MSQSYVFEGSLSDRQPVAVPPDCARYFVTSSGNNLLVISAQTGALVRRLSGHQAAITSVDYCAADDKVYTSSLDSTVKVWDIDTSDVIRTIHVGLPIMNMVRSPGHPSIVYFVLLTQPTTSTLIKPGTELATVQGTGRKVDAKVKVVRYDLNLSRITKTLSKHKGVCTGLKSATYKATTESAFLGQDGIIAYTIRKSLFVWNEQTESLVRYDYTKPLVSVAIHPNLQCIATGDIEGQIISWYVLSVDTQTSSSLQDLKVIEASGNSFSNANTSTRHWHAHACSSLAFTPDGSHMLSGGEEGVLVIWQLTGDSKTFIPRLGAPVTSVGAYTMSPDSGNGLSYVVVLADNSIGCISAASMGSQWKLRFPACTTNHVGNTRRFMRNLFAVNPRTGSLVTEGYSGTGTLQLLDINREQCFDEIAVVQRNYVSRTNEKAPPAAGVTHTCFSPDGFSMVTVDVIRDGAISGSTLKFWEFDNSTNSFHLCTTVEDPHDSEIVDIAFSPTKRLVCTASSNREFKLWDRRRLSAEETSIAQKEQLRRARKSNKNAADTNLQAQFEKLLSYTWECRSATLVKDEKLSSCCFSDDGSLLAIGSNQSTSLWDPQTNELYSTIPLKTNKLDDIQQVEFMGFPRDSATMVLGTQNQVQVYDMLKHNILYAYSGRITQISFDINNYSSSEGLFAVAIGANTSDTHDGEDMSKGKWCGAHILLFQSTDPLPVHVWRLPVLERTELDITGLEFIPTRGKMRSSASLAATLVAGTSTGTMIQLSTLPLPDRSSKKNTPLDLTTQPQQTQEAASQHVRAQSSRLERLRAASRLLQGPVQSLPSTQIICPRILDTMLPIARQTVGDYENTKSFHKTSTTEDKHDWFPQLISASHTLTQMRKRSAKSAESSVDIVDQLYDSIVGTSASEKKLLPNKRRKRESKVTA